MRLLQTFLAGVPYNDEKYSEGHFQSLLYVVFKLIGRFDAFTEVRSSIERSDMVVRTNDRIYLFELKFDGSAEETLRQIDIKNYVAPFSLDGLPIVKIGMNFSSETRTITDWLIDRP